MRRGAVLEILKLEEFLNVLENKDVIAFGERWALLEQLVKQRKLGFAPL